MKEEIQGVKMIASHTVAGVNNSSIDNDFTWKREWEKCTKCTAKVCAAYNCGQKDYEQLVGGHVWVRGDRSQKHCYIIPICKYHNGREFDWDSRGDKFWFDTKKDTAFMQITSHECYYH